MKIEEIKSRISLQDFLEKDGHKLRRIGSRWFCLSPFKNEKTPSCCIDLQRQKFHCFSTGNRGDVIDYWQLTRSVDRLEAIKQLSIIAGDSSVSFEAKKIVKPFVFQPPDPIPSEVLTEWTNGVDRLHQSLELQKWIADWRGYKVEEVKRWSEARLISVLKREGKNAVAFPVHFHKEGKPYQVGYHVRIETESNKATWRFVPKGIGSWPFILGNIFNAKALIVLEGQWDALAFCSATEWVPYPPIGVTVVGLRGATSWRKFLDHFYWPQSARAFVFADSDEAGMNWFEEEGFVAALKGKCHSVKGFTWEGDAKDFNEAQKKEKFTAQEVREFLRKNWR